jgi:hypothetical protein
VVSKLFRTETQAEPQGGELKESAPWGVAAGVASIPAAGVVGWS